MIETFKGQLLRHMWVTQGRQETTNHQHTRCRLECIWEATKTTTQNVFRATHLQGWQEVHILISFDVTRAKKRKGQRDRGKEEETRRRRGGGKDWGFLSVKSRRWRRHRAWYTHVQPHTLMHTHILALSGVHPATTNKQTDRKRMLDCNSSSMLSDSGLIYLPPFFSVHCLSPRHKRKIQPYILSWIEALSINLYI